MIFSNVNEDEFELKKEFVKSGVVYIELRLKNRGTRCLKCGKFTTSVKEYKETKIVHSLYNNRQCVILWKRRRFKCNGCGSTRYEDDPFRSEGNRISDKTVIDILDMLKRYNVPFKQAAEYFSLSQRTIMNIFDKYVKMERLRLSPVICIDEILKGTNTYERISASEAILDYISSNPNKEFMVVGGAKVYEELLPYVNTMYLTEIKKEAYADTFFPYYNEEDWVITEIGDYLNEDIPYVRNKYVRKKVIK